MIQKDTLAQLLLDFQEIQVPKGIERELEINLDIPIKRAITIIGPRRSGKTYLLYEFIRKLLDRGVKKEHIAYLNFEHPNLAGAELPDLMKLLDTIHELFPRNKNEKQWLFFDEIQNIPQWEKFIRHILDTEHAQVFLSGSSAKLLSKEIATSLRGRTITHSLLPFSFAEFLRTKNSQFKKHHSSREQHSILSGFREYLAFGGYPEAILYPRERKKIIQDIIEVTIRQDLIERYKIRNTKVIRLMFQTLVKAREFSVHGFYRFLRSLGVPVSKNSLYNYLEYFADAFVFFPLHKFSHSLKELEQSLPKMYSVDNSFIEEIVGDDKGRKMENAVFLGLVRKGYEPNKTLFYYSDDKEVDFVIREQNKTKLLIQVCYDLSDFNTKEREISALLKASVDLKCSNLLIITAEEEDVKTFKGKRIRFIPLWKWLLE